MTLFVFMPAHICSWQYSFSLFGVFFPYRLIPKRCFSMVNIAHVISQRLCHCNFQSLCVVKTSVRIINTHPEIALFRENSLLNKWEWSFLKKSQRPVDASGGRTQIALEKNVVRASVFQHTMYQSCNLIIISPQSPGTQYILLFHK